MCVHTRTQFDYAGSAGTPFQIFDLRPGFAGYYYIAYGDHNAAVSQHSAAYGAAVTALGVPLGADLIKGSGQSLVNDAFNRAQPDLTTVSVPNFLLELGDIKSLIELWKSNLSLAKNLAGLRLNYSFGWKPTIGDVSAMVNVVKSFHDKLKQFRESLGIVQNKTYRMLTNTVSKSGVLTPDVHTRVEWTASLSGTAKVHLKFRYDPIQAMTNTELEIRGLLDTLGFELNPKIIWDALPFTFVIDWFFGVGAWLNNFRVDTLELPVRCLDASVSYKEDLKVESRYVSNPTGYPTDSTSTVRTGGCMTTSTYFERRPFLPDYATLSGLGWKTPSFNQMVNLISLGVVLS
jgi:hypothetical protein